MCYDERFFLQRATTKAQERQEAEGESPAMGDDPRARGRRQTRAFVSSPRLIDRARSIFASPLFRLSRSDWKTATADDSTLSPSRPNISRLDQAAGLQLTVTAIRLVST
jgi:hypothetical protein